MWSGPQALFDLEVASVTSAAGGVISSGTTAVTDASFFQTGSALKATAGHLDALRIGLVDVTVGIASQSGATVEVTSVTWNRRWFACCCRR